MLRTDNSLYHIIQEVRQGALYSLVDDLAEMVNSSTNAILIFRRILVALAREYHFDEKKGFPEDKDGSGWRALCLFWNLCQIWDLPDKDFFARADSVFGNYVDTIHDIDNFLDKFPGSSSHLYWEALKTAFHHRVIRAHA